MIAARETTTTHEVKATLSTLWVFVMLNMVFADIVGLLNPGTLEEMMAMKPAQALLLVFAILLEVPMAMVVLSRVLRHRANRWANIIASVITMLYVIGFGNTSLTYLFFAAIEVACLVFIVWYAWTWTERAATPESVGDGQAKPWDASTIAPHRA